MVNGQARLDPTEDSPVLPPRGSTDNPEEVPLLGLGWGRSKWDGEEHKGLDILYKCVNPNVCENVEKCRPLSLLLTPVRFLKALSGWLVTLCLTEYLAHKYVLTEWMSE